MSFDIGDRILFLYDRYIIQGEIEKKGREYLHIKPDLPIPLIHRKVKPEKIFPISVNGIVVQEIWNQDKNSYRIDTENYPKYSVPLKDWKKGFVLNEVDVGFLQLTSKLKHVDHFEPISIEKHSFVGEIPNSFKKFGMENEIWEHVWQTPRFLRYWEENMKFPDGIDFYIAKQDGKVVGCLAHERADIQSSMLVGEMYRGAWIKPKQTGNQWTDFGNFGVYVPPEFRKKGISSQLFDFFEKENSTIKCDYPIVSASGAAYDLLKMRSKFFYPVENHRRNSSLFEIAKDINWMIKEPENERGNENGPFYGTKWKFGIENKIKNCVDYI